MQDVTCLINHTKYYFVVPISNKSNMGWQIWLVDDDGDLMVGKGLCELQGVLSEKMMHKVKKDGISDSFMSAISLIIYRFAFEEDF